MSFDCFFTRQWFLTLNLRRLPPSRIVAPRSRSTIRENSTASQWFKKKTDFLYFSAPAYLLLFYYLIPVNRFSISRAGVWLRCRLGWFSLPPVEFDNFLPVVDQITFSLPSPDWFAFLSVLDSLLSTVPSSASSISSGNGEFNRRNAAFLHLLLEAHSFLYLFLDCWITSQVTICSGFSSYFFTYPW